MATRQKTQSNEYKYSRTPTGVRKFTIRINTRVNAYINIRKSTQAHEYTYRRRHTGARKFTIRINKRVNAYIYINLFSFFFYSFFFLLLWHICDMYAIILSYGDNFSNWLPNMVISFPQLTNLFHVLVIP